MLYGKLAPEIDRTYSSKLRHFTGTATTREQVRVDVSDRLDNMNECSIGSVYFSTAGKMYIKVANTHADTDWQKVTSTAAD